MKKMKRMLSVLLCVVLLCGTMGTGASAMQADDAWKRYYTDYMNDGSAVLMNPGADETQRNFSWYSPLDAGTARVLVSENEDMTDARTYKGTFVQTPEGDRSNKVTVTGLWPGKTYYYQCVTDKGATAVASFSTVKGNDFTAMYTTDIHISSGDKYEDGTSKLTDHVYTYAELLNAAADKKPLDLIISAGDQATLGYRCEYMSLTAAPLMHSTPFAICPGNHDRKGIAYKYFTNNPNEYKQALVTPFISYDYYYVKGDVLFMVFDSNCASMTDHRNFIKNALRENPDVKWRVASFHHDLYGNRIPHRESENGLLRTVWAPIIDEFKFDLVLLGHSHYYTLSNAVFAGKTNQSLAGLDSVTDPKGAIVMVSGSVNHPRGYDPENEPPVGENIAYSYLTNDPIYNLLDFSEDSVTITSYTLGEDDPFHTFTVRKTTPLGGHPKNGADFYDGFVRLIADIYGFFNELFTTIGLKLDWNSFVGK